MSTLTVTTLSNGSVSVPTATVVNGSAKAWVNFNGTGTIAARDSFNVASLTDNGTGDYTVNFTTAFAAGDYSFTFGGGDAGSFGTYMGPNGNAPTASNIRSVNGYFAGSNFAYDRTYSTCAIHGDLA